MTEAAQSSLLSKTDSTAQPPRTIFIITTNSVKSMDPRFLSRFRVIDFEPESLEGELEDYLKKIYKKEGGRHPIDFEVIAKNAHFNVRDCLMKLEVELLIGTKRKGFSDDMKIIEAHKHECKKCHKPWRCVNIACELPHAGTCPACGGATTVGSHRGKKAWVTIRKKIADELLAKQNKKKVKQ